MQNTPAALTKVVAPADAQHVEPWVDELGGGNSWGRYLRGTRRATAGVEVVIAGWQDADGQVERHASVLATDAEHDAAALRHLAAAVLDTADELDRLARWT